MELRGIMPALTTPFAAERVDVAGLARNIARYERVGVDGYLVLGSTGEAPLLEDEERIAVLEAARKAVPAGKPLVAGVVAESTGGALRRIATAAACGADFVLVGAPHYFREQMTAAALSAHYTRLADGAAVPVLLYNVPKFTGLVLPEEVVAGIARHANVAGIKESSGDPAYLAKVLRLSTAGFRILCGASAHVADALAAGASGAVLAAASVFPEPFLEIARRSAAGDGPGADGVQAAIRQDARVVAGDLGVAGIKATMELRGLAGGEPRRPLLPADDAVRRDLERRLAALVGSGVLPAPTLGA
jgi:4-hydroxy-2-oxoglutarate aldolase